MNLSISDMVLIVTTALPILLAVLVPIGRALMDYLRTQVEARMPSEVRGVLEGVARDVVVAVEKQFGGEAGEAKKQLALAKAEKLVAARLPKSIAKNVSADDLDVLIEAAVASLRNFELNRATNVLSATGKTAAEVAAGSRLPSGVKVSDGSTPPGGGSASIGFTPNPIPAVVIPVVADPDQAA